MTTLQSCGAGTPGLGPAVPAAGTGRLWLWVFFAATPCLAIVLFAPTDSSVGLTTEGGLIESWQGALWFTSAVVAILISCSIRDERTQRETLLFGFFAAASLAREFDMHTLLNPETLGPWGVRYRIDWWLDAGAPVAPKLLWAAIVIVGGVFMTYALLKTRAPIDWRRARPRLVLLAIAALFIGFTMDDLLRGFGDPMVREGIEESAELLGAVLFLGAVLYPTIRALEDQRDTAAEPV